MASVFEPVDLEWDGKKATIPADRVMGAIARIEQHITLPELYAAAADGKMPPLSVLSAAYGTLLRYAGLSVSDEEVYAGIFRKTGGEAHLAVTAVHGLLELMIPPDMLRAAGKGSAAGNGFPAAAASPKKPSRSRSASGT